MGSSCSTVELSRAPTAGLDEDEEASGSSSYEDSSANDLISFSEAPDEHNENVSSEIVVKQMLLELDIAGNKDSLTKNPDGKYDFTAEQREPLIRFTDLSTPYCVFKDGLFTNPEVMVRVGPVIGKVTDTSAVVLLEVGTYSEVSLNFAPICGNVDSPGAYQDNPSVVWQQDVPQPTRDLETLVFTASGSVSVCHIMEPGRPCTFAVWGLEPATSYLVLLSNVCQADRENRIARFRTMPEHVESLRLLAISGQQSPEEKLGAASPWNSLVDLACAGPEVQLVLHVGSTIDATPAMAEAAVCLKDYTSFKEGPRRDQERRACEALRHAYCEAWGQDEGLQRLLSEVGSHLAVFAPPCQLEPLLRQLGKAEENVVVEEWRALLRSSLDIYYEYQRSLWHDASDTSGRPSKRVLSAAALAEESTEDLDERASVEFWQNVGGWSQGVVEEWHFHKYGRIGIFMLDTKGNRFRADGHLTATDAQKNESWPLISKQQWTALQEAMQEDSMQVLVLASDIPFIGEAPVVNGQNGKKASSMGHFFDWCSRPKELGALLKMVFEWKQEFYPAREAVLISAGHSFGTTGDVCDHHYGLNVPIVITGPVLGPVSVPQNVALTGAVTGRFSYVYRAPEEHCNFCTVDIDLEMNPQKPTVDVQLISVPLPPHVNFRSPPEFAGAIPLKRSESTVSGQIEVLPALPDLSGVAGDINSAKRDSLSNVFTSVSMQQPQDMESVGSSGGHAEEEVRPMRQSEVLRMLS